VRLTLIGGLLVLSALCARGGEQEGRGFWAPERDASEENLSLTGRIWFAEGRTLSDSPGGSFKFDNEATRMAVLDARFYVPRAPFVGGQVRFGTTLSDDDGELNGDMDCEAELGLMEFNAVFVLAGRSSPAAPSHDMASSYLEAFAGLRSWKEEFDCDTPLGDFEYEVDWLAVQVGLRGLWCLGDTYGESAEARHWFLTGEAALIPWATLDADGKLEGAWDFDQESNQGYGIGGSVGVFRRVGRHLTVGLGYEWQLLRADSGDHDQDGVSSDDLALLKSSRQGLFLEVGLRF